MSSFFVYAGKSSLDYNIGIEDCPSYPTGTRTVEKTTIPGRSGDLIRDTGAFGNYTQTYEIYVNAKRYGVNAMARSIAAWLLSGMGYQRLEDSYDPTVYRMACFSGPLEVSNWMLRYGRASIAFDCKPQRYLKAGERPVALTSGQILLNPGQAAKPLLTLTMSGAGSITINDTQIQIAAPPTGTVVLDCETQDAYSGATNLNPYITLPAAGWPVLPGGQNKISWSGGITAVSITPRWWYL